MTAAATSAGGRLTASAAALAVSPPAGTALELLPAPSRSGASGRDDERVVLGSVWFVWGDHREVVQERAGVLGREVRLRAMESTRPEPCFVEAWRVGKYGVPSAYYMGEGVGA